MKFFSTPNMLVKFKKPIGLLKFIKFDENGIYETKEKLIIERLKGFFEHEDKKHSCKFCEEVFENKGDLLVHYRKHKKEEKI